MFSAKPHETDMGSGPSAHRCVHLPGGLTAVEYPLKPTDRLSFGSVFSQNFCRARQAIQ